MGEIDKNEIRESVRELYGKIAEMNSGDHEEAEALSCCGPVQIQPKAEPTASCCGPIQIQSEVQPATSCCEPVEFSIEKMATYMGYSKEDLESVPEGANMGLGCGNPVAIASLKPGETVVDLGSGGGFDCFLAAKEVGETGRIIGVDMTPAMVTKARKNAEKIGASHVEFRLGEIEHLPIADNTANIIISNCVINLSPDKMMVYRDAFRVLKPGGRLSISDILATRELPDNIRNDLSQIGACVGGADTIDDTKAMLREAGFQDISIKTHDKTRDLFKEWDPKESQKGLEFVISAYIEAKKPV